MPIVTLKHSLDSQRAHSVFAYCSDDVPLLLMYEIRRSQRCEYCTPLIRTIILFPVILMQQSVELLYPDDSD
ncbi:MAG: hypothetical protein CLLPBCKN_001632 [Chroococcidiopsis cubana SAG 39.79]|nr:hypothetical protein [Chroococcidiopsis cubana SAG 39.79]